MMDFARNTRTRLSFAVGRHRSPIWSPDGTAIVDVTELADGTTIYRKQVSGARNDEVLLKSSEGQWPTSLSSDGRVLLLTIAKPGTRLDVWALPLEGDRKPHPLVATPLAERDAQLSPDGRWVAYVEQDVAGRNDVYVDRFPHREHPTRRTRSGRSQPKAATFRAGWRGVVN